MVSEQEIWGVFEAEEPGFIEHAEDYRNALDGLTDELQHGSSYVLSNIDGIQSRAQQVAYEKSRYEAEETIMDDKISEVRDHMFYSGEQGEAAEKILTIYDTITERVRDRESRLFNSINTLLEQLPESEHEQIEAINPISIYHELHPEQQQRTQDIQQKIEQKKFEEERREQGDPDIYIA